MNIAKVELIVFGTIVILLQTLSAANAEFPHHPNDVVHQEICLSMGAAYFSGPNSSIKHGHSQQQVSLGLSRSEEEDQRSLLLSAAGRLDKFQSWSIKLNVEQFNVSRGALRRSGLKCKHGLGIKTPPTDLNSESKTEYFFSFVTERNYSGFEEAWQYLLYNHLTEMPADGARFARDVFWHMKRQVEEQTGKGLFELLEVPPEVAVDFRDKLDIPESDPMPDVGPVVEFEIDPEELERLRQGEAGGGSGAGAEQQTAE